MGDENESARQCEGIGINNFLSTVPFFHVFTSNNGIFSKDSFSTDSSMSRFLLAMTLDTNPTISAPTQPNPTKRNAAHSSFVNPLDCFAKAVLQQQNKVILNLSALLQTNQGIMKITTLLALLVSSGVVKSEDAKLQKINIEEMNVYSSKVDVYEFGDGADGEAQKVVVVSGDGDASNANALPVFGSGASFNPSDYSAMTASASALNTKSAKADTVSAKAGKSGGKSSKATTTTSSTITSSTITSSTTTSSTTASSTTSSTITSSTTTSITTSPDTTTTTTSPDTTTTATSPDTCGNCATARSDGGCDVPECQSIVCNRAICCCNDNWDSECADDAQNNCPGCQNAIVELDLVGYIRPPN